MWLDSGVNATGSSARPTPAAETRRVRTWEMNAATEWDAMDKAREAHLKVIGWNGAIWISKCEMVG